MQLNNISMIGRKILMSCRHKCKKKCCRKVLNGVIRYLPPVLVMSDGFADGNLIITLLGLALINHAYDLQVLKKKIENTCWY